MRASAEEISKLFRVHRIEIVGHGALTLEPTQTLFPAFLAFHGLAPSLLSSSATILAQVLAGIRAVVGRIRSVTSSSSS